MKILEDLMTKVVPQICHTFFQKKSYITTCTSMVLRQELELIEFCFLKLYLCQRAIAI